MSPKRSGTRRPAGVKVRTGRAPRLNSVRQVKKAAKQRAFLAAFADTCSVRRAAAIAKIDRTTHYTWLEDEDYRQRFKLAQDDAVDQLECEARRRALEGVEEPVGWYMGEAGGTVRRYSDTLLIFLLKAARPEKYRERTEISGPNGGPIEVEPASREEMEAEITAKLDEIRRNMEAGRETLAGVSRDALPTGRGPIPAAT